MKWAKFLYIKKIYEPIITWLYEHYFISGTKYKELLNEIMEFLERF